MSHLKVRYQHRPKHNKPGMRASTMVKKASGLKKPFKASQQAKKTVRRAEGG